LSAVPHRPKGGLSASDLSVTNHLRVIFTFSLPMRLRNALPARSILPGLLRPDLVSTPTLLVLERRSVPGIALREKVRDLPEGGRSHS